MALALGVAALGAFGCVLRYLLDHTMAGRFGRSLPFGTMTINIIGSGFGGILVGAALQMGIAAHTETLLLTGLLGGFTTASTFSFEVAELLRRQRFVAGVLVAVGTMTVALFAGAFGVYLGEISTPITALSWLH
jgi:CrcB protein